MLLGRLAHNGVKIGQVEDWERSKSKQVIDHLDGIHAARQGGSNRLVERAVASRGLHDLSLSDVKHGNDAAHGMKVFIFEYVCGGGFQGDSPPPDLLRQGREMLQAALMDFSRLPDPVQVYTLIEERFAFDLPEGVQCRNPDSPWYDAWLGLVRHCDAVLVVAPESERQLELLCTEVLEEGRESLNCSLDAIRLAADKWALNRHLQAAGISAVDTRVWNPSEPLPERGVIKPRYGAGCEETFVLDAESRPPVLDSESPWVWQPWVPGEAVSLSLLAGEGEAEVLSCNRIHCENREGRLHVHGIETGGLDDNLRFREAAQVLASQIMVAMPGLRGYVGVDGMWQEGLLTVLEINPRLTLTYAGLSMPLAEQMLRVFDCEGVPA